MIRIVAATCLLVVGGVLVTAGPVGVFFACFTVLFAVALILDESKR